MGPDRDPPLARRLLLIANPSSGQGRGQRWLERARQRLAADGVVVEVLVTRGPGDARARMAQGPGDQDGVWAIGGDGTINELLPGLVGTSTPLSILPAGTGNVVAREAGVPRSFAGAYGLARSGPCRPVDVGLVNRQPFLFMVSAGFDAAVVGQVAARRTGSMRLWHYAPAVWRCRQTEEPRFRVIADGQVLGGACWVAVMNTQRYAGGFRLCPEARMDDGRLDLLLLRDPVAPRIFRVLRRALAGGLQQLADAAHHRCQTVRLEGVGEAQVDGDPLPAGDLDLSVQPGGLWLRGFQPR